MSCLRFELADPKLISHFDLLAHVTIIVRLESERNKGGEIPSNSYWSSRQHFKCNETRDVLDAPPKVDGKMTPPATTCRMRIQLAIAIMQIV